MVGLGELASLNLYCNHIGDRGGAGLLDGLRKNYSLSALNIGLNRSDLSFGGAGTAIKPAIVVRTRARAWGCVTRASGHGGGGLGLARYTRQRTARTFNMPRRANSCAHSPVALQEAIKDLINTSLDDRYKAFRAANH
jgi:hypothetical protein